MEKIVHKVWWGWMLTEAYLTPVNASAETSLLHPPSSATFLCDKLILITSLLQCPGSFDLWYYLAEWLRRRKKKIKFSNSWDWGEDETDYFWSLWMCFDIDYPLPLPLTADFKSVLSQRVVVRATQGSPWLLTSELYLCIYGPFLSYVLPVYDLCPFHIFTDL